MPSPETMKEPEPDPPASSDELLSEMNTSSHCKSELPPPALSEEEVTIAKRTLSQGGQREPMLAPKRQSLKERLAGARKLVTRSGSQWSSPSNLGQHVRCRRRAHNIEADFPQKDAFLTMQPLLGSTTSQGTSERAGDTLRVVLRRIEDEAWGIVWKAGSQRQRPGLVIENIMPESLASSFNEAMRSAGRPEMCMKANFRLLSVNGKTECGACKAELATAKEAALVLECDDALALEAPHEASSLTDGDTDGDWLLVSSPSALVKEREIARSSFDTVAVEVKVEQLLTWMLAPAVHGISGLGVPGAVERAAEILAEHHQDVESAIHEVIAGSERTVSKLVTDFCIERIPVLGCPTVLLRSTWGNLRSILIIAALYGHNIESARTQHEALLCLVPPGEDADTTTVGYQGDSSLVGGTARKVARNMIKGAVKRATGLEAAVDCLELATLLYSNFGHESVDEDGFVHVMGTPASTARDFFRKRSLASRMLLWCSLPMLCLGSIAPSLLVAARHLPNFVSNTICFAAAVRRWCMFMLPLVLLVIVGVGVALFAFGRYARFDVRRRRLTRSLHGPQVQALRELWPRVVTMFVFTLHSALPALSTSSAVGLILGQGRQRLGDLGDEDDWDPLHWVSCAMLGVYSLCSVLKRQLENNSEGQDIGVVVRCMARCLHWFHQVARFYCVLAAWMYASLMLDLGLTHVLRSFAYLESGGTALGFIGPVATLLGAKSRTNPLSSDRALTFSLSLVSVASQQHLVEILSRREVLLSLIGAERMMASTLCLLLKGVAVAAANAKNGTNPLHEFLLRVAPPPMFCVACVTLREQAVLLGFVATLAPKIFEHSHDMSAVITFAVGLMFGAYAMRAVLRVWYSCHEDLDSPALRLAWLLVPGNVSGRTKGLLRGVLASRGRRAVQLMAANMLERALQWWVWLASRRSP